MRAPRASKARKESVRVEVKAVGVPLLTGVGDKRGSKGFTGREGETIGDEVWMGVKEGVRDGVRVEEGGSGTKGWHKFGERRRAQESPNKPSLTVGSMPVLDFNARWTAPFSVTTSPAV